MKAIVVGLYKVNVFLIFWCDCCVKYHKIPEGRFQTSADVNKS